MNTPPSSQDQQLQRAHALRQWRIRQIIIWSSFACLYAAPCYILARQSGYDSTAAHVAMFCGILTYIIGLSALTSMWWWRRAELETKFGLALNFGRYSRGVMAIFSAVAVVWPMALFELAHAVDMWSGMLATSLTGSMQQPDSGGVFLETYLVTVLTGFCVLITLFLITMAAGLVLWLWAGVKRLFAIRKPVSA